MSGDKTNDLPGLGRRLADARTAAGLTQEQVARMLKLPRPSVTEMENETRRVSAGELKELARIYKVSVEWLTGEGGEDRDGQVRIAARKLSGLKDEDFKMVVKIIDSLRKGTRDGGTTPQ